MSALDTMLLIVLLAVLVWTAWGLVCNEITYSQRKKLIRLIAKDFDLYWSYASVTYSDHCRALMFLRDPYWLYGADLRAALSQDTPSLPSEDR